MVFIENKVIPFGDFGLMNLLGVVFTKIAPENITRIVKRHEQTHTFPQYELLAIAAIVSLIFCNVYQSWWYLLGVVTMPFMMYIAAFLLELVIPPYHNAQLVWNDKSIPLRKRIKKWAVKVWVDAYSDNCFEREAYMNEKNIHYFATRRFCGWLWYIIPRKDRK